MALPEILKKNLRLPVIGAPLFIISHPALVIAQCKAGIVGSFPSLNARPLEQLDEWLHEIREALDKHDAENPDQPSAPFAVNMIVHKSNMRLEKDMELVMKHKVPIVITSLGARPEVNDAVHSYGGITLHDVINQTYCRKAIEKGADGLIVVAAGAGGHAGKQSPFAIVQETREWFDGPLICCQDQLRPAMPFWPPKPWAPTWPMLEPGLSQPKRPALSMPTRKCWLPIRQRTL